MCGPMLNAAAQLYGGIQANKAAHEQAGQSRAAGMAAMDEAAMQAELDQLQAHDVLTASQREADQIKRQAKLMRATIVVAQSGSGAMIGEGSAAAALDQLDTLSSADALAALYSGADKAIAIRQGARMTMEAGRKKAKAFGDQAASLENAGRAALIGSIISAGATAAQGYKPTPDGAGVVAGGNGITTGPSTSGFRLGEPRSSIRFGG